MKRNRSGQIEFGLNWVGQILITIILIYVASLLVQNLALGDAQAESVARNMGVTFDVLATVVYSGFIKHDLATVRTVFCRGLLANQDIKIGSPTLAAENL